MTFNTILDIADVSGVTSSHFVISTGVLFLFEHKPDHYHHHIKNSVYIFTYKKELVSTNGWLRVICIYMLMAHWYDPAVACSSWESA